MEEKKRIDFKKVIDALEGVGLQIFSIKQDIKYTDRLFIETDVYVSGPVIDPEIIPSSTSKIH